MNRSNDPIHYELNPLKAGWIHLLDAFAFDFGIRFAATISSFSSGVLLRLPAGRPRDLAAGGAGGGGNCAGCDADPDPDPC